MESDVGHVPMDVVEIILLKLPVKSLNRFRCVSKQWNSLISQPSFVIKHHAFSRSSLPLSRMQMIVLANFPVRYTTLVSLPEYNITPLTNPFHIDINSGEEGYMSCKSRDFMNSFLVASCDELWCVSYHRTLFLWNPSLKSAYKKLPPPPNTSNYCNHFCQYYGMGYDALGDDFKVVRIPCEIERARARECGKRANTVLYSLREDHWRRIPDFPGPFRVTRNGGNLLAMNGGKLLKGGLHWMFYENTDPKMGIVRMDICSHDYLTMGLPESINQFRNLDGELIVANGMLHVSVFETRDIFEWSMGVWAMKDYGVEESWTKIWFIQFGELNPPLPSINLFALTPLLYHHNPNGPLVLLISTVLEPPTIFHIYNQNTLKPVQPMLNNWFTPLAVFHTDTLISPATWASITKKKKKKRKRKRKEKKKKKEANHPSMIPALSTPC